MNTKKRSSMWLVSEEDFKSMLNDSMSMTQFLAKFGFSNKGYNYKTARARIILLGLSTEHFATHLTPSVIASRPTNEQVFQLNTTSSKDTVKLRLRKAIPYLCFNCEIGEEWHGKKLVLQIEHINGNNLDNRLSNLCWLCPNCHSQTDTFAGKNCKREHIPTYCSKCALVISNRNTTGMCFKCFDRTAEVFSTRKVERPPLDVVLKQTKELGFSATGRLYGVSDNAIRKWLKNL